MFVFVCVITVSERRPLLHDPGMIHKAVELSWIFGADGLTNEGVPRGPRGPKNGKLFVGESNQTRLQSRRLNSRTCVLVFLPQHHTVSKISWC